MDKLFAINKKGKVLISLFVLAIIFMTTLPECMAFKKVVSEKSKEDIIEKHLKNRQLELLEGVYSVTYQHGDASEIAIVKNTTGFYPKYQYIGIALEKGRGKPGEALMLFNKTAANGVYSGGVFLVKKNAYGMTLGQKMFATNFVMQSGNIMTATVPHVGLIQFVRTDDFPATQSPILKSGTGTGFFIANNLIATNAHVIEDAKNITVVHENIKVNASIVNVDKNNDVAILMVNGMENVTKPLPLGDPRLATMGEPVSTVGFPWPDLMGYNPKAGEGIISSLTGIQDDMTSFQISVPIQPGNSGGPLLNKYGQVIGITSHSLSPAFVIKYKNNIPQNTNYAIKISYLVNISPVNLSYSNSTNALSIQETIQNAMKAVVFIIAER